MAKSRQEKWIMCRLRRKTHRLLLEIERRWIDAHVKGLGGLPPDDRDGIGLDRIVQELIRRDEEHRQRSNGRPVRKKAKAGVEDGDGREDGDDKA
jgi:hypothetical protein